ncbi:uncharacterized protein STEHIDRAFT_111072 [Stereum hirsutum FP-91666 SS1]|uniref:uncharacterized protein n=1 Tax=Stereum hirsutum (strain FP-91666) TaxID=721885 RepID=UPI0004409D7C|nr:uncharacterized protein STEHIDRAFT_111072 [Stereum hirsutum FP-91666 SS1]EIM86597.1 hypothetical protein STEHIDRAFT_111072 [Stereum hirsutum FP-91666 SS1]
MAEQTPVNGSVPPSNTDASKSVASTEPTIESSIDHAKRAFALRKYEQAVDHYATALELMTVKYGEDGAEMADVYLAYGKALLENAIQQAGVLGKEQQPGGDADDDKDDTPANSKAFLSFSGDADDAVYLFAEASKAAAEADAGGGGADEEEEEEEDVGEPEDDFNAAWEVLDLARAIYEKQKEEDEDEEITLKLADTYIALGDISLETEKFEQGISDYTSGLALKSSLLPLSSRQLAEAHYKLSMVLDLTSGRLADAILHAQKALESVEARLAELQAGIDGTLVAEPEPEPSEAVDKKGKGKATGMRLKRDDLVQKMSKSQIQAEKKELEELKGDLAAKVEELKTSPNEIHESAPEMVARALDSELNKTGGSGATAGAQAAVGQLPVNDLTTMVKKKKKPVVEPEVVTTGSGEKRKADEESESPKEKKARLEEPSS